MLSDLIPFTNKLTGENYPVQSEFILFVYVTALYTTRIKERYFLIFRSYSCENTLYHKTPLPEDVWLLIASVDGTGLLPDTHSTVTVIPSCV